MVGFRIPGVITSNGDSPAWPVWHWAGECRRLYQLAGLGPRTAQWGLEPAKGKAGGSTPMATGTPPRQKLSPTWLRQPSGDKLRVQQKTPPQDKRAEGLGAHEPCASGRRGRARVFGWPLEGRRASGRGRARLVARPAGPAAAAAGGWVLRRSWWSLRRPRAAGPYLSPSNKPPAPPAPAPPPPTSSISTSTSTSSSR